MLHQLSRVAQPGRHQMFVANAVAALAVLLEQSPRTFSIMLSQMLFQLLLPTLITACCF